jgi:3-oxoacyl-[acyl-carrier protein] reductase
MTSEISARQLFDLTGQVALVTGASSGLGARFAEVLAAQGAKVILAARRLDRVAALAAHLPAARAMELDVTKPQLFADFMAKAADAFGPVNLLVNNAGVADSKRFIDTPAEEWDRVRATNVDAVWHLSQAFARALIAAKTTGAIINIASIAAYRVAATPAAYAVSKAAVEHMTKAMAVELARYQIRVNAIAPGYIHSEMTDAYLASDAGQALLKRVPQRRAGQPSDLDGALMLLASPKASAYMTGATIVVDGGHMWSS